MIFFFCQNNELYKWIVYPYTYTTLFMNFGKMACINKISLNINFPLFCFRIVQKLKGGGGFILNYIFRSDFKWYRWFLKQKWRGKPPSPLLWLHICTCINNLRQTPFFIIMSIATFCCYKLGSLVKTFVWYSSLYKCKNVVN